MSDLMSNLASTCKDKLADLGRKDLKDILKQLGLPKKGKKQDLVDRVLAILSDEQGQHHHGWGRRNALTRQAVAKVVDDTYRKMQLYPLDLPSTSHSGSSTSSLPPLPAAGPPPILEELLGPAVQAAHVLTEISVSMTEILAVGGFLGALGFAVHVGRPWVALLQLLGLTATAPALGTPMIPNQDRSRRTRSRWEPDPCNLCNSNEVSYFFSCCGELVCSDCASGLGPAMCTCNSMRHPVLLRPQYWPIPRRTVPLLRHPIWQIYNISDEPNFIVIRYFRPEDAAYSRETTGIRYSFHFFFMEGARWTRWIIACYTAIPRVQEARIVVIDYNPEGNNEAESQ